MVNKYMKKLYKSVIKFLYKNYCGTCIIKFFGSSYCISKSSRIIYPFCVIWGVTKLFQNELYFSPLDLLFTFLFIVQYLSSSTMLVFNEYNRLNK
jgi:ABC-type anion transport system duplicated permease subunit